MVVLGEAEEAFRRFLVAEAQTTKSEKELVGECWCWKGEQEEEEEQGQEQNGWKPEEEQGRDRQALN